jgi:uncharacterized protein (TIGR03437 family)
MKRTICSAVLLAVGAAIAYAQAVVDGFSLDQISFTAVYSGNVPCSEYGQAGFAVRQFPGVVQYIQVVAQLAGSTAAPAWIVQNVPASAGAVTEWAPVNLTLLGVQRGACITGSQVNYTLSVTNNVIAVAPSYTGNLSAFVGQQTNNAQGMVDTSPDSPGTLPPPESPAALLRPEIPEARPENPEAQGASASSGDLSIEITDRPGMGNVPQALNSCAPSAVTNSMHWLQSTGSINLNGDTPAQSLAKVESDMSYSSASGTLWNNVVVGKLLFSQRPEHPLNLDIHYQADTTSIGMGASVTAGSATANRDGSGGPPTFDYIQQQMALGQDVELGLQWLGTDAAGNTVVTAGHMVAVSGIATSPYGQGIRFNDATTQNNTVAGLRTNQWAPVGKEGSYISLAGQPRNRIVQVTVESPKPVRYLYYGLENNNTVGAFVVSPLLLQAASSADSFTPRATASGGLTPVSGSPYPAGNEAVATTSALGQFLYAVNYGGNNLSAYQINRSTGALTPLAGSPFAVGGGPFSAVVDPSGHFLYVGNYNDSTVSAFTIDPITGVITAIAGSPFSTGSGPAGLAVSPSGRLLFVANGGGGVHVHSIDPTTGALTVVSGSPFAAGSSPNSIAAEPSGQYVYVVNAAFGTTNGNISAFSIGPSGALTPVPGSPFNAGTQPDYIVVDSTGQFAYVSNYVSGDVSAFTINSATGALVAVAGSPYPVGAGAFAVATDSASQFVYASAQGASQGTIAAFTINPASGALTAVAGSPFTAGAGPARMSLVDVLAPAGPANPVPALTQLAPSAAATGGSPFVMTIYGDNFVPGSVVRWNGASRITTFVSVTRLDVVVPSSDLTSAASASVTVVNPAPSGGASNSLKFTVAAPVTLPSVPGNGTLNDAGFQVGMAVAPGSIAASFGTALASGSTSYTNLPPATLGGSSVMFNGSVAAPLFFTSTGQINMQIPWEVAGSERAFATFTTAAGTSAPATISIAPFAPGVFTLNAAGQGAVVINNSEVAAPLGSIPGLATRPATQGDYLSIYCTGLGAVTNQPATGAAAPLSPLAETSTTPTVTIGGVPATVGFSGLTPTSVGLYQVNVQVPPRVPTGSAVPLVLSIGGQNSNTTTIASQ